MSELQTGLIFDYESPKKLTEEQLKEIAVQQKVRTEKLEKRLESMELVILYANDLVEMWPNVSMRTLSKVTEKIYCLKQALGEIISK